MCIHTPQPLGWCIVRVATRTQWNYTIACGARGLCWHVSATWFWRRDSRHTPRTMLCLCWGGNKTSLIQKGIKGANLLHTLNVIWDWLGWYFHVHAHFYDTVNRHFFVREATTVRCVMNFKIIWIKHTKYVKMRMSFYCMPSLILRFWL